MLKSTIMTYILKVNSKFMIKINGLTSKNIIISL